MAAIFCTFISAIFVKVCLCLSMFERISISIKLEFVLVWICVLLRWSDLFEYLLACKAWYVTLHLILNSPSECLHSTLCRVVSFLQGYWNYSYNELLVQPKVISLGRKVVSLECCVAMAARWEWWSDLLIGGHNGASFFKLDMGLTNHIYLSDL